MIERFNRTLKQMLFKYFDKEQTFKWYDVLPKFINNYNNSYHSTIEMNPSKVNINEKNRDKVERTYEFKLHDSSITNSNQFEIGDNVRLKLNLGQFDKKYKQRFSQDIYTVVMKYAGREGYIYDTYRIKDKNGNVLPKKYTYFDLLLVPSNTPQINRTTTSQYHKTVRASKKSQVELGHPKEQAITNTLNVKANKPIQLDKRVQPAVDTKLRERPSAEQRLLGRRVNIYWPSVKKWFKGHVKSYDQTRQEHIVYYDIPEQDGNHEIYEKLVGSGKVKWKYI